MQHMKWIVALLWLLALLLAGWTLRQLPFAAIGSTISALAITDWLWWILLNAVILLLAALRWDFVTRALGSKLALGLLFRLRQAGSAVSFLTPGPHFGGEPLQLYWLYRHGRLPLHRAMLSLGLDRFFEMFTNFSVLLAGVLMLATTSTLAARDSLQIITVLSLTLLAMLAAALVVLRQPQWLTTRFEALAQRWRQHQRLSRIDSQWQQLGAELRTAVTTQRPRLLLALVLSILGWIALLAELQLLLHFLGLALTPAAFILLIVAMRLAMLLPMPGGIGSIEAALLWSFQLLQLPAAAAIGLIALTRLRDAVVLLIGLYCLYLGRNHPGRSDLEHTNADNPPRH